MKRIFEYKHYSTIMFFALIFVSFLILFNLVPPETSTVTGYQIAPIQNENPVLVYYTLLVSLIIPILLIVTTLMKRLKNG